MRVTQVIVGFVLSFCAPLSQADLSDVERGKTIAFDRNKGNCLACHAMDDGPLPGAVGPPLLAVRSRFPQRDVLRQQVWDASVRNPATRMPPFGRHGILSEEEIDLVIDYLYTL